MGDIFQEVDEEVRRDQYGKLWKQYGGYVIAGAVALVLGTAISVGWQEYKSARQQEASDRFAAAVALVEAGKPREAADALRALTEDAGAGFALIARFREASALSEADEVDAAMQVYEGLAGDSGVEDRYRQLATLLIVMHQIDTGDPAALRDRLTPLMAEDAPWRYSARELSGALALRTGDRALAKTEFQRLADDTEAPQGLRARSTELLRALGD